MEKTNKIIQRILISIWVALLCFAVIWFIEPQWLKDISSQGKIVESTEHKLKGDEMLRQGYFQKAYEAYSKAIQIENTLQAARIGKAIAAEKLGREKESLKILNDLLKINPDKPWEVYLQLSVVYEKLRNKKKTIEALNNCIESSPNPFDATLRLARLYITSSEWQEAYQLYISALDLMPSMINEYRATLKTEKHIYKLDNELKSAIEGHLDNSYDKSIENKYYETPYKLALAKDPIMARIYNDTGFCLAMMDNISASLPYFERAVSIQPQNEEYNQNYQKAKHELDKQDK